MKGGFRESPLRLNAGLGSLTTWNETTIINRGAQLAEQAISIWSSPKLQPDVLALYRAKNAKAGYTIEDHPYLLTNFMRGLFEAFRKEVLALDPCVNEEFFKTCIAYKAETNFVDVVPQAKRLQLTLNLKPGEIDDPKRHLEDISGIGHLGYGDVRATLSSSADLPYIMGLVRQSFEKQMAAANE